MKNDVIFTREWAMPNPHTFQIPPIRRFIAKHLIGSGPEIMDPFCGESTLAKHRNDMRQSGIDSIDWIKQFPDNSMDQVHFDPAYSPRQRKECYDDVGVHLSDTTSGYWGKMRDEIRRVTKVGGKVLSFGWNSVGIGKTRGFKQIDGKLICFIEDYEIIDGLIVSHGGNHNDTICVAEIKLR